MTYAERPLLFHNLRNGKFQEIGASAGPPMNRHYVSRGLVTADFLNNGRRDLLMTVLDGSPVLLRNTVKNPGHWLRIKPEGTRSNRDGFGARIEIKAGGELQQAEVRANSSFESASDPRREFGLGSATKVDSIVIRWPSGNVETLPAQAADQEIMVREGSGIVSTRPTSSGTKSLIRHPN